MVIGEPKMSEDSKRPSYKDIVGDYPGVDDDIKKLCESLKKIAESDKRK